MAKSQVWVGQRESSGQSMSDLRGALTDVAHGVEDHGFNVGDLFAVRGGTLSMSACFFLVFHFLRQVLLRDRGCGGNPKGGDDAPAEGF